MLPSLCQNSTIAPPPDCHGCAIHGLCRTRAAGRGRQAQVTGRKDKLPSDDCHGEHLGLPHGHKCSLRRRVHRIVQQPLGRTRADIHGARVHTHASEEPECAQPLQTSAAPCKFRRPLAGRCTLELSVTTDNVRNGGRRDAECFRECALSRNALAQCFPRENLFMPLQDRCDLGIGELSGPSDRAFHDRLPEGVTQATLPAPLGDHAAAQPSQAASRACKHGRGGRAPAWTARTA